MKTRRPKILLAIPQKDAHFMLPEKFLAELEAIGDVVRNPMGRHPGKPEEYRDLCSDADALITRTHEHITGEIMDALPNLKIISCFARGGQIDWEAAARRGIKVVDSKEGYYYACAELAVAMMLVLLRRLTELDRFVREGNWTADVNRFALTSASLAGRVVGLVGYGGIARWVARLVTAFGSTVWVYDTVPGREFPYTGPTEPPLVPKTLEEIMRHADVISIHARLVAGTRGLISRELISLMKPSAILINTARGELVDEEALTEAVIKGKIAGVGIDTWCNEPVSRHPLFSCKNAILTPHTAARTDYAIECQARIVVDAIKSFFQATC